jgi:hypothetical protein
VPCGLAEEETRLVGEVCLFTDDAFCILNRIQHPFAQHYFRPSRLSINKGCATPHFWRQSPALADRFSALNGRFRSDFRGFGPDYFLNSHALDGRDESKDVDARSAKFLANSV